jgi:hypothetical protein
LLLRYVYHKTFMDKFTDKCEWQNGFNPDKKGSLVWYTDGSKSNKGTGAGVYRCGLRMRHSFSLGPHTTLYQAETYAIKARIMENMEKATQVGTSIFIQCNVYIHIHTVKHNNKQWCNNMLYNYSNKCNDMFRPQ